MCKSHVYFLFCELFMCFAHLSVGLLLLLLFFSYLFPRNLYIIGKLAFYPHVSCRYFSQFVIGPLTLFMSFVSLCLPHTKFLFLRDRF